MDIKKAEKFFRNLLNCKFDKLWSGKELGDFQTFVLLQGIPAGGFLITIPMYLDDPDDPEDKGYTWFFYEATLEKKDGRARLLISSPKVSVPMAQDALRERPEQWKSYPVWRYTL